MLWSIIILLGVIGRSLTCPISCICKWKGGKQTVECMNKSLITIPDGMDQGTQVLDFSGNNLQHLPRERFQRMGLINLQKIFLSRCRIIQIDDRSFKGLTNLVDLDLSDNLITTIPTETFYDYPSLMRLTLNGNSIKELKSGAFQPLSFLTNLDLNNCQIERIEDGAFVGLDNLEWLKLDNNKITRIEGNQILPETLHGIDLHHNPWYCDCKLLDLRAWLLNYNVPHTVEPKCNGPQRLKGYTVRSLEIDDLACLPDVTPTTLYLEIAEGKNVSLICRVSATPEARVSWWFQGNVLQNDSMIAPGLHLYYYIEEGTTEKKSELFIFNTNIEDNGTFVCVAENPAGRSQSNYTIRIVLKEEPVVGLAVFPYEYVIIISAAVSVLALMIFVTIALCFIRCRRQRKRRRKKERSKEVALQMPQQFSKSAGSRESSEHITRLGTSAANTIPAKANGSIVISERQPHEMLLYSTGGGGVLVLPNNHGCTSYGSPTSLRNYPLEQNPDLINDMESVNKERRTVKPRSEEKDSATGECKEAMESIMEEPSWRDERYKTNMVAMPRGVTGSREIYQQQHLTADVHLSPSKFIGNDGYPVDYGLPKVGSHFPVMVPAAAFYRTLPHKSSRHTAANPGARYSREAEFLSKSVQPPSYEHFNPADVRYTVEGYPCAQPQTGSLFSSEPHNTFTDAAAPYHLPSPPAQYKGEATCNLPRDASAQWPETSPDTPRGISICNAAAQTTDEHNSSTTGSTKTGDQNLSHNSLRLQPVLTESPDEGYEGETADSTDI
ncbi:leucine-rich repeat, immunoglobulin-like domain-containing kekkon 2 protein [Lycorma delicatula]|uniref:leucine-rich repeat, immunoglobulin-like domain-containing kekkon 2 protein n=1 Tax=Lycorma delicatula TaxID=130591 RepID=UPI003F512533